MLLVISLLIVGFVLGYLFRSPLDDQNNKRPVTILETKCKHCADDQLLFYPVANDQICNNIRFSFECWRSRTCNYVHAGPLAEVFKAINNSTKSLDICMYQIKYRPLFDCLVKLRERTPGLKIRIITHNSDDDKEDSSYKSLRQELIDYNFDVRISNSSGLMHHKFVVIDNVLVMHGSANWTYSAFRYNSEVVHVTKQPKIVASFRQHFNQLWRDFR